MSAIKLFADLMVGTEIEAVSMWESANLISIFFPFSVNPFLALSPLNLGAWLFQAVGWIIAVLHLEHG